MNMGRMISYALALLAMQPMIALAQSFTGYKTTTLDAVVEEWNEKTKSLGPGVSLSPPAKIKFVASMNQPPMPCNNGALRVVLRMIGFEDLLKQVKVSHCVTVATSKGRTVTAYVQDVLVPGLNDDVKVGGPIEIYADILAYQVDADRSRNAPIMLVNRFEPQ
jgi:hypothetical protein